MNTALTWNRRTVILGAVALVLLLGLLLLGAPASSRLDSGSTWHRGPSGYSAWYESLEQQDVTVQRWQRPVEDLLEQVGRAEKKPQPKPIPPGSEGTTTTLNLDHPSFPNSFANLYPFRPPLPLGRGAGDEGQSGANSEPNVLNTGTFPHPKSLSQNWERDFEESQFRPPSPRGRGAGGEGQDPNGPETLVAILPGFIDQQNLYSLIPWMPDWLEAGHRLVVLGWKTPTTAAPFSQVLSSDQGTVQIDTRRRYQGSDSPTAFLKDEYGSVAWEQEYGSLGRFIAVTTPHLGANAYLNQPGNLAFLTELVTREGGRVWIDEYLHGYRDADAVAAEVGGDSWLAYLGQTPLLILGLQALGVTLLALLAFNRRLGPRQPLKTPQIDNSQAYIQALAGVLYKANSHDFVVQTLSQAERITLQKALGLGTTPVPIEQLQAAWVQQYRRSSGELADILTPPTPRTETQLRDWLQRVQSLQPLSSGDSGNP
ncbi:hypothetical protein GFS31_04370 [Leptolyngbya sp. BL0902]|uniref:DUF4350 domain-containing protein n=1 Tax=Leptolyngbya sp. BL0902 TaxID=1115757 RepID=UPI0018E7438B|nr:DUF4350 domain-containing protein [Leptolyngbya sp. BL0902]QQE63768.1 hypothetical protein GFS31_04370 [Leptolyngbya sp. BL0902]